MAYSAELRQQIENLALRLVMAEPQGVATGDWLAAVEGILELAGREEARAVVSVASEIATSIQTPGGTGRTDTGIAERLHEGVVRLQQAVEETSEAVGSITSLAQDPELMGDFILESREHLASLEGRLLALERDPSDAEELNAVFRGFHTIKGLAGFLELPEVQELAHETEALLDHARSLKWTLTTAAIDLILESADHLRRWLSHLEGALHHQTTEAPPACGTLLSRLREMAASTVPGEDTTVDLAQMAAAVEPECRPVEVPSPGAAESSRERLEASAVKVDTGKLDYLVDMAGEMVIAESLVRHDPELAGLKSQTLQRKVAQMTRITAELQKTAMSLRLVPIGPLFRRMSRLVRDLSRQFQKEVRMETEGDDIELDRTIVEELADPLMHMVRNAMDHGIEMPAERREAGKDRSGRVLLRAQHRGGQVVIEVADDGRGLDPEKIRIKAVQKGLIEGDRELSESETYNLIFEPGFTTAAQVTNVSGRGVGMDVVRRHIEKLRGRIETRSKLGGGTTFLLKLPLTLAIIDGLVVGVGSERYIVPIFAVREMFRPSTDTMWTVQQSAEMALVRGTLLPVLRLYRRFGVTPRSEDPMQSVLLVAEVEGAKYCLIVDELIGKQEVVIKSLGEAFRGISGIAGGAILGDGRVGLILDLDRLLKDTEHEAIR